MHRRSPAELPDLPRWVCVLVLLGVGLHLLADLRHRGVRPGHVLAGLAQMEIQGRV